MFELEDLVMLIGADNWGRMLEIGVAAAEAEHTSEATDEIADRFVQLYRSHVWEPHVESGMAPEELPNILEQLNRLQPLAIEAVAASMRKSLQRAGERALNEVMGGLNAQRED